ncbi:Histone-fold-containing protein [Phytophthora palmivora]|uniref:Histone-fold-containing protein n=1 Tax=Phytophthora palmivora TaxID=4796 RepID=A0A2P4YCI3_9STRA|nr:Histone-fold-containing protein [Phytophthora palmivora]
MSGRGNGAQGIGHGGPTRHRSILRDTIHGMSKQSIYCLARRAGVIRISGTTIDVKYALTRQGRILYGFECWNQCRYYYWTRKVKL